MAEKREVDTTNEFGVGVIGDDVSLMLAVPFRLSKERALVLAAYLVSLADDGAGLGRGRWEEVLLAVHNT